MYFVKVGCGRVPIVFLHGWGCDGSVFLPIAERLCGASCYLPDLEGFGRSVPLAASKSVADYARDVHEFIVREGLGGVLIVGHSFGCRVALRLAADHPEDVRRMLFVAPAGLKRFSIRRAVAVAIYKLKKRRGILDTSRASADWLACDGTLRETFVRVVNEDLSRVARCVRCPVLIVNGDRDTATPLWHAKRLARLLANGQLVVIAGDHYALFRAPRAFVQIVEQFAEGL